MSETRGTIALMVMLATLLLLPGCAKTPPEQKLRDALTSLQTSIETRDASALEATLADDFVGQDGMGRDGARQLARLMFLRHRDIGATLGPPRIDLQDQHATVRFTAALTGGAGGILPDAARIYEVETAWRMEDGAWHLISAQWSPRL